MTRIIGRKFVVYT